MIDPELSVVCFRHVPAALDGADLTVVDSYQKGLQRALEVSGDGWVSTTTLDGRTYLRAGIVNYLSTEADVDRVVDTLRRLVRTRPRTARPRDRADLTPRSPRRSGSRPDEHGSLAGTPPPAPGPSRASARSTAS